MLLKVFYGENCNVNCRNSTNYYKAIKPFLGKSAQNAALIQHLENNRLVADPTQVGSVLNTFQVCLSKT